LPPVKPAATPVVAEAPRVEVQKVANGTRTWRIIVIAADSSTKALRAAKDLAVKIDAELAEEFDGTPAKRNQHT